MSTSEPHDPTRSRRESLLRRTIRKRWIPLLTQWGILSTALVISAYFALAPRYTASAWLKVDTPPGPILGDRGGPSAVVPLADLETEVQIISSPGVLEAAVNDPAVAALPWIANATDPEAALRGRLSVAIQPNTQLILVSSASREPKEASVVVNAVVFAYLKTSDTWTDHEIRARMDRLKEMKKKFEADQSDQRERLKKLTDAATRTLSDGRGETSLSAAEYRRFLEELSRSEIERIRAESELKVLRRRAGGVAKPAKDVEQIEELATRVEALAEAEQEIKKRLTYLEPDAKGEAKVGLDIEYAEADLRHADDMLEAIGRQLDQLDFEARSGSRVTILSIAKPGARNSAPGRLVVLAAIPVLVMAGLLTMFMKIEVWSSRRAPDQAEPSREGHTPSVG